MSKATKQTKIKTAEEILQLVEKENKRLEEKERKERENRKPYVDELLRLYEIIVRREIDALKGIPWRKTWEIYIGHGIEGFRFFFNENKCSPELQQEILQDSIIRFSEISIENYSLEIRGTNFGGVRIKYQYTKQDPNEKEGVEENGFWSRWLRRKNQ